jgi:hypothetical protein
LGYRLAVSPCARYVHFEPTELGASIEELEERHVAIRDFAKRIGTNRLLIDWSGHKRLPLDYKLYEAVFEGRGSLEKGAWRYALLYSLGSPHYSINMVTGFADVLEALGQRAEHFCDHEQAVAWLVSDT